MKAKRIIVFGGCGHGKGCFSRKLSGVLGIPTFDLDDVTFDKDHKKKVSDVIRDKELAKIVKGSDWIVEGAYAGDWLIPAVEKAELIIIIKINSLIALKRVLLRFLKRRVKKVRNSGGPITDLPKIVKFAVNYKNDYFPKHVKIAKNYSKDFVILRNNKQIDEFLGELK